MNTREALELCKVVGIICPAQRFDEHSEIAWAMALDDITLSDAMEALRNLAKLPTEPGKYRYIEPGHVRSEVRRIRARRIDEAPAYEPRGDETPVEYIAGLKAHQELAAAGKLSRPEVAAVNGAGVQRFTELTRGVGRE